MANPLYRSSGDDSALIPEKAMVAIEDDGGVRVETRSHIGTAADLDVTRTYAVPTTEETTVNMWVRFRAEDTINLGIRGRSTDRFRFLTLSGRYENAADNTANVILYEDRAGVVRQIPLNDPSWKLNEPERNGDVFKEVDDASRSFGTWFELVKEKEPGGSPDSATPSIRIDVINSGGLKLGLEAYLYRNTDTNKRFVDCWVEWHYDQAEIAPNTKVEVEFKVTATLPRAVESSIPKVARKANPCPN